MIRRISKLRMLQFGIICLLLFSCSRVEDAKFEHSNEKMVFVNGVISPDDSVLTSEQARLVAQSFFTQVTNQKDCPSIDKVELIDSCIYVVNFKSEGGYVLVSSTKKQFPILAFSPKGSFNTTTINNGAKMFLSEYVADTRSKSQLPISDVKDEINSWRFFEKGKATYIVNETKNPDPITSLIQSSTHQWVEEGYDIYQITEESIDGLPNEILSQFKSLAEMAEDYGEEYHNTSFILKWSTGNVPNYSYLLESTWGQENGYNFFVQNNNPLGCVTVALGQILYYHKYIQTSNSGNTPFNFNLMHPTYPTTETARLLSYIRDIVAPEPSSNGASNIYIAKSFLTQRGGYSSSLVSHVDNSVIHSINDSLPVYMRGVSDDMQVGHAWVCDGYTYYNSYRHYKLMSIIMNDGPLRYSELTRHTEQTANYRFFHMNWGWNGYSNGWYSPTSVEGFSSNRLDLVEIRPL